MGGGLGGLTPKLWAPLKPVHWDGSFGTLQSQIRQVVIEILESKWKNLQKNKIIFLVPIFTTRRAPNLKTVGTVEFGLLRHFICHLAKSKWTNGYGKILEQE